MSDLINLDTFIELLLGIALSAAAVLSVLAITVPLIAGIAIVTILILAEVRVEKFFSTRRQLQANKIN